MNNPLQLFQPSSPTGTLDHAPSRVLGIDLGTTNSTAACMVLGRSSGELPEVRCVPVKQETQVGTYENSLIPSVVAFDEGREYVGEGAKRLIAKLGSDRFRQNRDFFVECKNDMGLRRTYPLAPEGFQSAPEIAAKLLSFIKTAADNAHSFPIGRTVVTVPASFQTAQRLDTMKAAALAGIQLDNGELLDEPVAAFLDYVLSYPERLRDRLNGPTTLAVFDFGGGTCDVAVFDLNPGETGIDISPRAVSRYHRLGGGDIDRAIVYSILIPQLCRENGLGTHDLGYEEKRLCLEPILLPVAESLKIQVCRRITELKAFGRTCASDMHTVAAQMPATQPLRIGTRVLRLSSPRLSASEFKNVLNPFLDRDLLWARETEYYMTNSIFAPIQDALDRAGLDQSVVSLVLLAGGSSLIPPVQQSIKEYFSSATILMHDDEERVQTMVARGAVLHAYTLEVFGKPLLRSVAHETIYVKSASGLHELVHKGEPLAPADDESWRTYDGLAIGQTSLLRQAPLRLELVAGSEQRLVYRDVWHIPPPVRSGERLLLRYRFDQNQVFEFRLSLDEQPDKHLTEQIQNPLTHVVNPQQVRLHIEEVEEQLRRGMVSAEKAPEVAVELARKYAELGQYEKAVAILQKTLQVRGGSDSTILNLLGIYCGNVGDDQRQDKFYREAARAGAGSSAWFNLALAQEKRGDFQAALASVEELEKVRGDGPALTLKVLILDGLGITETRNAIIRKAISLFRPLPSESEWELGWHRTAAHLIKDKPLQDEIAAEEERRRRTGVELPTEGELPIVSPTIVQRR